VWEVLKVAMWESESGSALRANQAKVLSGRRQRGAAQAK
jgi:hypothetical protein